MEDVRELSGNLDHPEPYKDGEQREENPGRFGRPDRASCGSNSLKKGQDVKQAD